MSLYNNFIEPTYKTTLKNALIQGIKSAFLGEFSQNDIDDFNNSINEIDNASSPESQADVDDTINVTANSLADAIEQYIDERIGVAFSGHQHHQHGLAIDDGSSFDNKIRTLSETGSEDPEKGSSFWNPKVGLV